MPVRSTPSRTSAVVEDAVNGVVINTEENMSTTIRIYPILSSWYGGQMVEAIHRGTERRSDVLDAALRTFTRFGYRKTSMDDVAKEAQISRPGLYFLFTSKDGLFREAAERGVEMDLAAAEEALVAPGRPMNESIAAAFDAWAGRYIGPIRDTAALIADNPDLLGPVALDGPARFEALLTAALKHTALSQVAPTAARTLISLSIGIKHQAETRDEYRSRFTDALGLLLSPYAIR
jgi:AcrR family transcriptional regulator